MDRYRYRAATAAGDLVEGVVEAPSRQRLLDQLRAQRLYPTAVEPAPSAEARAATRMLSRAAAVAVWTRDMATLLEAGLALDRALEVTAAQAAHADLEAALRAARRDVQGGMGVAEALRRYPRVMPPVVTAMVAAGEASGALDAAFAQAADHLEDAGELRSQLLSALLYPALMATVATLGVLVLLLFVIPRFVELLADVGGTLPMTTRVLVAMSGLAVHWWWLWLLAGVAAALWIRAALADPRHRRRWDAMRLDWPVVGGLERDYAAARFTRTLGLLLQSGVAIVPAMRIARGAVGNAAIGSALERAAAAVADGSAVAPALGDALPPLAVRMVAIGEESGRLEDLCHRAARTYDARVRRALRAAVALVEPVLILLFGGIVGFVALAMLQAIYSVNANAL